MQLRFVDSGKGIPKDIQDKMMIPFFSTRELGEGSGLGLPMAERAILASQGKLMYEDYEGHTSFVVSLPLIPNKPSNL